MILILFLKIRSTDWWVESFSESVSLKVETSAISDILTPFSISDSWHQLCIPWKTNSHVTRKPSAPSIDASWWKSQRACDLKLKSVIASWLLYMTFCWRLVIAPPWSFPEISDSKAWSVTCSSRIQDLSFSPICTKRICLSDKSTKGKSLYCSLRTCHP